MLVPLATIIMMPLAIMDEPKHAEHYMRKAQEICERAGSTRTR